jgi:hypothetical protein
VKEYSDQAGNATLFTRLTEVLNPVSIYNNYYSDLFIKNTLNLDSVLKRVTQARAVFDQLEKLLASKESGSYGTFGDALKKGKVEQICSLDIIAYVYLKEQVDDKSENNQVAKILPR